MLESTLDDADRPKATKRLGGVTGKGFLPGSSGNPAGVSREANAAARRLRSIAAGMTEHGLRVALSIAADDREKTADRLRAVELIVRCGHADAVNEEREGLEKRFVVRPFVIEAKPTPGVLNSPIRGHIGQVASTSAEAPDQADSTDPRKASRE